MKHISRRSFLLSCVSVTAILKAFPAEAGIHVAASTSNNNSTIVNAGAGQFAFLNIAKGFQLSSPQTGWPGLLDANQYPNNGALTSNMTNVIFTDPTYFGRYLVYWTESGTPNAGFQLA